MHIPPPLTRLFRGGVPESLHRGAIAVSTGERTLLAFGAVDGSDGTTFPRSALKPFQALPLLEERLHEKLALDDREIALTAASHGGDEQHVEVAASLMRKGEVPENALLCGIHPPLDEAAARRLVRAGVSPSVLHHNCSGKHAGMVIQARQLGAPIENYVDPEHPVQQRIRDRIAQFSGVPASELHVAIDGCSAPAYALPLSALARAMARFADPAGLPPTTATAARRLFDATMAAPHFVSGRHRFDLAVTKASGGRTFCKAGAEGVVALAIRPPRPGLPAIGIAAKVEDGNERGYHLPILALLRWLGFEPPADREELSRKIDATLKNYRGLEVGKIELDPAFAQLPRSPWA